MESREGCSAISSQGCVVHASFYDEVWGGVPLFGSFGSDVSMCPYRVCHRFPGNSLAVKLSRLVAQGCSATSPQG